jgi:opacity protein-like surface antigen
MLKKLVVASALFAVCANVAVANAPYIGFAAGSRVNTSEYRNFRGVPANVFVGYGATIGEGVYLAGEVFSNLATANVNDNGLKSTFGYGISFIPGLMLSDHTMGFARLGVLRTKFEPAGLSTSTVSGGQLGVGIQTSLMQNWDLRGEYDFMAYSHISQISGNPRTDEFHLGMVYKFD